jgi:hypothetical protein
MTPRFFRVTLSKGAKIDTSIVLRKRIPPEALNEVLRKRLPFRMASECERRRVAIAIVEWKQQLWEPALD